MNRLRTLVATALLALPIVAACGEGPTPPPPKGSIAGKVLIENGGIDGVTVTLSDGTTATTASGGSFGFDDVEAGTYTLTITNYPADADFPQTTATATISREDETVTVNFAGAYIRTSAIMGAVTVEGDGLSGVTVRISGMSESETLTGGSGQYSFSGLRAGNYTVEISGFDGDDVAFGSSTSTVAVAVGESKVASFDGTYVRASSILVEVTVEGDGLEGVTVSLQGKGEKWEEKTNGAGQHLFEELRRGDYVVAIFGYDKDEYDFETTSRSVKVERGETGKAAFEGIELRTAEIEGVVTVEGLGPLEGVTVSLSGPGDDPSPVVTLGDGRFGFDRLYAGDYTISIFGYNTDEYGFEVTSRSVKVERKETAEVAFAGIRLRTSAIEGEVTIEGEALPGVTVTVTGGLKDEEYTKTTGVSGRFEVGRLHQGDYSVSISGYDADEYGFEVTTKSVTVALRETAEVAFDGVELRTAEIEGVVTVEGGEALSGVKVMVTGGPKDAEHTLTTNASGRFGVDRLYAGDYSVSISGYDMDEYEFEETTKSVTVALKETAELAFEGIKLRTAAIGGVVTIEGEALSGVKVMVTGGPKDAEHTLTTSASGRFGVDRLHAGDYSVSISGYDMDEYEFEETTKSVTVALKETAEVEFDGIKLRTAVIGGEVTVEGDALSGVTVTVTGGLKDEERVARTNASGRFGVERLHAGDYTVAISGYDKKEYRFDPTSESVTVDLGETETVAFDGIMLRTAAVSGIITLDGEPFNMLKVGLSGEEDRDPVKPNARGQYGFSGLGPGDYTIELSAYDTDEYWFESSTDIDLKLGEAAIQNLEGRSLRTVAVKGMVTAEGEAIENVQVRLSKMLGANQVEFMTATMTNEAGEYMFDALLTATYLVDISGYDAENEFPTTTRMGKVETDDTATWNFDAAIKRTASVSGMVTVDDAGMGGVKVMLKGGLDDADEEMTTESDGSYIFDKLRKGDYTVSIENPNESVYDFPTTSWDGNLAVDQKQDDVSFAGSTIERASISGQVYVEDPKVELEGVEVTLGGDADETTETDANGEYNFQGLADGDYTVSIENPDPAAYVFEITEVDVDDLAYEDGPGIVDFVGEHTTTASIVGTMFLDEVNGDGAWDVAEDEPAFKYEGIPVLMSDPNQKVTPGLSDTTGAFAFTELKAGRYRVAVNQTAELKAALTKAGYKFEGQLLGQTVTVPAGKEVTVNFPFRITKQTINVGANLATKDATGDPKSGVKLMLYPTAEDAENRTNSLGPVKTTNAKGWATFEFDREDDTGPGGGAIDHLVYAMVTGTPANTKAHDGTDVVETPVIEVEYEAVDRVTQAPAKVKLIDTKVAFGWSVKSDATAKHGDQFLKGWEAAVMVGSSSQGSKTTGTTGKASFSGTVPTSQLANLIAGKTVTYAVSLASKQDTTADMGEKWTGSKLTYAKSGLKTAVDNSKNSKGDTIRVKWTSHTLVLGFHREADDEMGYSDYESKIRDHRPYASVGNSIKVEFFQVDSKTGRVPYEYKDGCTGAKRKLSSVKMSKGLVKVRCLPANGEPFMIQVTKTASDMVWVGRWQVLKLGGYLEPYKESDLTTGGAVLGRFGAQSGGVPEVRICLSSEAPATKDDRDEIVRLTADDKCSTWAYQWESATISGTVGAVSGFKLSLDAQTTTHGATDRSGTTKSTGAYSFTDLRDGRYDIYTSKRNSAGTYEVVGDTQRIATDKGALYVYHDEATGKMWAGSLDTANWKVKRVPKETWEIQGFIGNDSDPRDKRFRGDETKAGITVTLSGSKNATTLTDDRGFYKFTKLTEGKKYSVRATSVPGKYLIVRTWTSTGNFTTGGLFDSDEYPTADTVMGEGKAPLPYWSYTSRRVYNTTPSVTDGKKTAKLANFVLLYQDGTIEGAVHNLSWGDTDTAKDIDIWLFDRYASKGDTTTLALDFDRNGTASLANDPQFKQLEGKVLESFTYYAAREDDYWGIPCMSSPSSSAKPDDDGPKRSDGSCLYPAPTKIEAETKGRGDTKDMGTLYFYDTRWSSNDRISSSVKVSGNWNGTGKDFDKKASMTTGWSRGTGDNDTTETTTSSKASIGTTSWKSNTVTFTGLSKPSGGELVVTTPTSGSKCTGNSCTLGFSKTGVKLTTIEVKATAANGYDDHKYTLKVGRAAPVGNDLVHTQVVRVDSDGEDTDVTAAGDTATNDGGSFDTRWTMMTASDGAGTANVRIDLATLGSGDNAYCAQSVKVMKWNTTTAEKAISDGEDDVCEDTRYRLSASQIYKLEVSSEDGRKQSYYMEVRRPAKKSDDSSLKSLGVDKGALVPAFNAKTTEYSVSVKRDTAEVTLTWEENHDNATSSVSPADANTTKAGHQVQLDLGDTVTVTVSVVSESKKDTTEYVVEVDRAPLIPGTVSTLSALSLTKATLDPAFDEDTTYYTADVAYRTDEVTVSWTLTDENASVTVTPADDDDDATGHQVSLNAGATTPVLLKVVSEDEADTTDYTVAVSRPVGGTDSKLESLRLSKGEISPEFVKTTTTYTASIDFDTASVTVSWAPSDTNATVKATGCTASGGSCSLSVPAGSTRPVTLKVVAEDESDTTDYTLRVTRRGTPVFIYRQNGTRVKELTAPEGDTLKYTIEMESPPDDDSVVVALTEIGDHLTLISAGDTDTTYTFTSSTWSVRRNVRWLVGSDDDAQSTSKDTVIHTGTSYDGGNAQANPDVDSVPVVMTDDDTNGLAFTGTAWEMAEAETQAYNVWLTAQPTGNVTVTVTPPSGVLVNNYAVELLRFTPEEWNLASARQVTVSSAADDDTTDINATITHASAGGGYDGVATVNVNVRVVDDEAPQIIVQKTAVQIAGDEVGDDNTNQFTYSIQLTQAPSENEVVTVRPIVSSADFRVSGGTDGAAVLNSSTWDDGVILTVTAVSGVTATKVRTITHQVSVEDSSSDDQKYKNGDPASSITVTVTPDPS